ncbi:SDR family NAD(P)-dependent oxidoreductase [Virgisporangium aliadipatigenens]|nr:SDR family NAD(P)-dependent oxidoreductase [Virgisporangium aliadipatigenens]
MANTTIALVTGGNKGIGFETAAQLAATGATVLLGARDRVRREEAVAALRATGADVHPVELDVTDPASAVAAAALVDATYGRLDVLVNNAAVSGGWMPLTGSDPAVVRAVFDTNVVGVMNVTNAFLPLLRRSAAPRVVNVSSSVGSLHVQRDFRGPLGQLPGSAAYVPSKAALNALTVQYAKELRGTGILVNAVDPGYCATDFNNHAGTRPAAAGAANVVRLATVGNDGPTGGFYADDGAVVPW